MQKQGYTYSIKGKNLGLESRLETLAHLAKDEDKLFIESFVYIGDSNDPRLYRADLSNNSAIGISHSLSQMIEQQTGFRLTGARFDNNGKYLFFVGIY